MLVATMCMRTSLLGAAYITTIPETNGKALLNVFFNRQKKKLPGGASIAIKQGVLKNPARAIFGQHVHPPLDAGGVV
ncbi:MAG: hypothetical protein R2784_13030 [Saprospiraceae bacterium]